MTADRRRSEHAFVTRHCWVTGLRDGPGRWAGLLVEWQQQPDSGPWAGRVVHVVDEAGRGVVVERWVDADPTPAGPSRRHLTAVGGTGPAAP